MEIGLKLVDAYALKTENTKRQKTCKYVKIIKYQHKKNSPFPKKSDK